LRERQPELDALGVRVFAVTFESEARVREFQARAPLPFPVLRDPCRVAYRAFGLERRGPTTVWNIPTLWFYLRRLLRGQPPPRIRADPFQLGGDVILSADGRRGWAYASRDPVDRPSADGVVALASRAARHRFDDNA